MAEVLNGLLGGFATALTVENLLFVLIGVTVGTAIGVLPGIGGPLTISLLLPLTFGLEPVSAFIMFAGIYYGSQYGASTTSILVRTPGEGGSVITTVEGHEMARRGRAGAALATAAIGSFVAGAIAAVMVAIGAPALADFALLFGPVEYFAVVVFALTALSGFVGRSVPKALFAALFGLALGTVGLDSQSGQERFTFGLPMLLNGIDIVLGAIALFAVSEVLVVAASIRRSPQSIRLSGKTRVRMSREDVRRSWPAWLRGSFVGFFTGVIPGAGATVGSFLSYNVERRVTRRPRSFGKGAIEGVAGPEAANNAASTGALVPLLTLGVPGSGTTAVMLAAFQLYGLQPGPLLFQQNPTLVWGIIASLFIGNVFLVLLNLPLVGVWVQLLKVPSELLYPLVGAFAILGVYTLRSSVIDLVLAFVLGVAAFFMRRHGFPLPAVILGLVLGPLAEVNFRRALQISEGNYATFVSSPTSVTFLLLSVLALVGPYLVARVKKRPAKTSAEVREKDER